MWNVCKGVKEREKEKGRERERENIFQLLLHRSLPYGSILCEIKLNSIYEDYPYKPYIKKCT